MQAYNFIIRLHIFIYVLMTHDVTKKAGWKSSDGSGRVTEYGPASLFLLRTCLFRGVGLITWKLLGIMICLCGYYIAIGASQVTIKIRHYVWNIVFATLNFDSAFDFV